MKKLFKNLAGSINCLSGGKIFPAYCVILSLFLISPRMVLAGEEFSLGDFYAKRSSVYRLLGPNSGSAMRIYPASVTLGYGESITFFTAGGTRPITYSLSNSTYGSINSSGVFTARRTSTDNNFYVIATDTRRESVRANVNIIRNEIQVIPSIATVGYGTSIALTASGGYNNSYNWTMSNASMGTISASTGLFTARNLTGNVTVRAEDSAGTQGTATISVVESGLAVRPTEVVIERGQTVTFSASGGTGSYSWRVNDSSIGTIDSATGQFTARTSIGSSYVIVTDSGGSQGTAEVRVVAAVVRVQPSVLTITRGGTQDFTATRGTGTYFWTSSNIALGNIVFNTGRFTALNSTGTLTINVEDSAGNQGSATVNIVGTSVTLVPSTITVARGSTQQFSASGGTGTYYWSVSNSTIGAISSSGLFTASGGTGTLTVTATDSAGNTGTATVTVSSSSLTVSPYTVTLGRRQTQQFTSIGGSGTVYWSVSDRTRGSISSTGLFTAKTLLGATTVTATDSLGNSGTASVNVERTVLDISPPSWFVSNSVGTAGTSTTNNFSVAGGSGSYYWSISNNATTASYISPTHFSVSSPNTAATNTIRVAIPTSNLGSQTLTVLVQDTYGDSGTATVTVEAAQ